MTLSLEPNLCLLNKKIKETIKMFPWYKRLIEDDKIESITNIPLMTSDILEKYYYSNPLVGNYDVYQTSGTSSGNRKKIFYSPEDDENYIKLRANIYRKFIPIDSMKLVFSDMGTGHAANTAKKVFESLNLSFESVSYDAPIEQHIKGLEKFKPDIFYTMPSILDNIIANSQKTMELKKLY